MILYGKPVAQKIETDIKSDIEILKKDNIKPFLAVILAGDDPASILYTRKKREKAESLGIGFRLHHLPANTPEQHIIDLINLLNANKEVDGILIQLPLPSNFDTPKILAQIKPQKDVDGLNGGFLPPTVEAIFSLLEFYKIDPRDKKTVIIGRGKLVGQPLEKVFNEKNFSAVVCDSKTENLKDKTLEADIIISGVGKADLIKPDMVKDQVYIIDAGTAESNGSTVGDVGKEVCDKVAGCSPVPGGVGPVTVIDLMKNLVEAAKKRQ